MDTRPPPSPHVRAVVARLQQTLVDAGCTGIILVQHRESEWTIYQLPRTWYGETLPDGGTMVTMRGRDAQDAAAAGQRFFGRWVVWAREVEAIAAQHYRMAQAGSYQWQPSERPPP